nr:MAG: hypothetical protein DIU58_18270 [Sphaerobacter thermophilus]
MNGPMHISQVIPAVLRGIIERSGYLAEPGDQPLVLADDVGQALGPEQVGLRRLADVSDELDSALFGGCHRERSAFRARLLRHGDHRPIVCGLPGATARFLGSADRNNTRSTEPCQGSCSVDRMSATPEAFRRRIEEALQAAGITKAELARRLAKSPSAISEWWTKQAMPEGETILRLPEALSVSGHWLLTGEGPMERPRADGEDPYRQGAEMVIDTLFQRMVEIAERIGVEWPKARDASKDEPGSKLPELIQQSAKRRRARLRQEKQGTGRQRIGTDGAA